MTPRDLAALSSLLDVALETEPSQWEEWLETLDQADRHLVPALRAMLAEHAHGRHADFMAAGARLADESPAADDTFAKAGDEVGPYRLIREIGRGGMGTVWLAEWADGRFQRRVALKLPRLAWAAGLSERIARERDIGAMLEHPNIARLYDAGVDQRGRPYLAIEYIDGNSIDTYCQEHGLTLPQRLRLFMQVARSVAYAHGRLVVHRDLKPSNVLVTKDGQTHLLDFGIAKLLHEAGAVGARLTQEQGRMLTLHYASPEQVRDETITVQSDVYSLGVLLYELLTGSLPYRLKRQSLGALEEAIVEGEPELASTRAPDRTTARALRGELDAVLAKALRRAPGERYRSADALADDIERHLDGERVLAQPDTAWYRVRKTILRHRFAAATSGIAVLAVVLGAGVAVAQAMRANDAAARSQAVKDFVVDAFRIDAPGNPASEQLRELPAELLLERAASQIETRFAGQPRLQADLFGVVTSTFADMGSDRLAHQYADRHLQALVALRASPKELANALLLVSQTLIGWRDAVAEAHARQALELAAEDRPLSARVRLGLAHILFEQKKHEEAAIELDAADRLIASYASAPSIEAARSTYLRAELTRRRDGFAAAAPLYEQAIERALQVEGPLSRRVTGMRLRFVDTLVAERHAKEARTQLQAALDALRTVGGVEDIGASIAEAHVAATMFEVGLMPADEALKLVERAHGVVSARQAPEGVRARADFILGKLLLDWGHVERAYALLDRAIPVLRGCRCHPDELIMAVALGHAARASGIHIQADAEFRRSIGLRLYKGGAVDKVLRAGEERLVAVNLRMQGRYDDAEAVLLSPAHFEAGQAHSSVNTSPADVNRDTDPFSGDAHAVKRLAIDRALIKLERGDPAAAMALLTPYAESAEFQPLQGLENASLIRAAAQCALGRSREALPALQAMTDRVAQVRYPYSAEVAQLRAITGLCAIDAGERGRAGELAELARQAFIEQPGVSPYYKVPLRRLEKRLHRRP
ncbi:serine/threonine-protein kinase [Piscinibacter sp. XHJ-5]|uniref:serine/threonine-protein kinase n=1 Tax=Piscinibacter sp. XHJ-5 TaxID=3037797 RepID=UPI002452CDA1|nr:serine/threonine-protein kinase [Piscinibacter sp. XHJ-5]